MNQYTIPIYTIQLVRDSEIVSQGSPEIKNPNDCVRHIQNFIGNTDREHFIVVMLSSSHVIAGINTVAVGSLNSCIVHPREVFKPAILSNAQSIIVAHNHPSRSLLPSKEDHQVTERLKDAGKLLNITLLDHIIIIPNSTKYYSFQETGIL